MDGYGQRVLWQILAILLLGMLAAACEDETADEAADGGADQDVALDVDDGDVRTIGDLDVFVDPVDPQVDADADGADELEPIWDVAPDADADEPWPAECEGGAAVCSTSGRFSWGPPPSLFQFSSRTTPCPCRSSWRGRPTRYRRW